MTYFVIAGNSDEYSSYVHHVIKKRWKNGDSQASINDYVNVISRANFIGVKNPHGVFFGTWRKREDINEILIELFNRSDNIDVLHKIQESLNQKPQLSVAVNGALCSPADYTVSTDVIVFNNPLTYGDQVSIVNVVTNRVYVAISQAPDQRYFIPL